MNSRDQANALLTLGFSKEGQTVLKLLGGLSQSERASAGLAMVAARKKGLMRMRIEYKPDQDSYLIHDLQENGVYYLSIEHLPEWAKEAMALLSILEPESTAEGVGFFYAPGVFYVDVKADIPEEHRRYL